MKTKNKINLKSGWPRRLVLILFAALLAALPLTAAAFNDPPDNSWDDSTDNSWDNSWDNSTDNSWDNSTDDSWDDNSWDYTPPHTPMNNPLSFPVKQTFTTTDETVSARFIYRLAPITEGSPMPPGSTAQGFTFVITGNSSVLLGPITFTQPGEYRYELYQVIPQELPGYAYDERIYIVVAYVSAGLDVELVAYNKDGSKADQIVFNNGYGFIPTNPELMTDPPVIKTVIGNPSAPIAFFFKLTANNAAYPMPAGSANGIKTITVTGSGTAYFGKWSYTQPGTYYYTVSEVNTGAAGYTYDTAVFTITDIVRDDGYGQLVLTRIVTNNANRAVTSLSYINYYKPTNGPSDSPTPHGPTNPPYDGPTTGDDANANTYYFIFTLGAAIGLCALAYMALSIRNNRMVLRYEQI